MRVLWVAIPAVFAATFLPLAVASDGPLGAQDGAGFNATVRPILVAHCLPCHGGVKRAGGISFVTRELALTPGDSGTAVIEPGDAAASYLVDRISDPDDDFRMPPPEHGRRLSEREVETIRRWIDAGGVWEEPWAFRPPRDVAPELEGSEPAGAAGGKPLDRFVLARLAEEGLEPAPQGDRAQWLRRVSFDLVGLPPTEAERVLFQSDSSHDAYERVVDRLLASPHFGERWASVWLDLARYADTKGFERDPPRDIWPWRDWVVRALNADLPYDRFLLQQTAGDLLPGASLEDRLATACHRNTQTNAEGGTDDEEFRWAAVADRVEATWSGVLGMTMACARCHDHPYDPLTHADYYRFAAFFNNTQDCDLLEDWPTLPVPTDPARFAEADRLQAELRGVRDAIHRIGADACARRGAWRSLAIDSAASTGETRLEVRPAGGKTEVWAEGTVSDRSVFTVAAPAVGERVTALRIDVSPRDPAAALATPESGFVLSRVRVFVERAAADGGAEPVVEEQLLVEAFADEANGFFRPIDSIRDTTAGWGAYTRLHHARWAAVLLDAAVELGPRDRVRVELKHGMATDGQGPLVIPRFVLSVSDDAEFARLAADTALSGLREREEALMAELAAIPSVPTPVLAERPAHLSVPTHRFDRGNWLAPKERLTPGTPERLSGGAADRLALGRWLGAEENPLTARVMVNRVWAELFGVGIVETLDDFGSTGAAPSHPELLDHLAVRFRRDLAWSIKGLLRELVLSDTYRRDARASADAIARDPGNRLLSRGPRGRLRAEMVRDQALVLSGRLYPLVGGPPVMPFQPEGVWNTAHNDRRWENSAGRDRYRRALYTYWKRTAGYPSMTAFDAPSREQCAARRPTTNTPLQALVTLNDPAFVELAGGLAARMLARQGDSIEARIAWAGQEATGRPLPKRSIDELRRLYDEALPAGDEPFATAVVANVLLNLDATLTK